MYGHITLTHETLVIFISVYVATQWKELCAPLGYEVATTQGHSHHTGQ